MNLLRSIFPATACIATKQAKPPSGAISTFHAASMAASIATPHIGMWFLAAPEISPCSADPASPVLEPEAAGGQSSQADDLPAPRKFTAPSIWHEGLVGGLADESPVDTRLTRLKHSDSVILSSRAGIWLGARSAPIWPVHERTSCTLARQPLKDQPQSLVSFHNPSRKTLKRQLSSQGHDVEPGKMRAPTSGRSVISAHATRAKLPRCFAEASPAPCSVTVDPRKPCPMQDAGARRGPGHAAP
jgi:hypothetical protein